MEQAIFDLMSHGLMDFDAELTVIKHSRQKIRKQTQVPLIFQVALLLDIKKLNSSMRNPYCKLKIFAAQQLIDFQGFFYHPFFFVE